MEEHPGVQKTAVFTIGHSTRPVTEFIEIIRSFRIVEVADIRTIPGSRHNPQFNEEFLKESLKTAGIGYIHMKGLGGLRRAGKDSPNKAWRNASFRGFADYMQTAEFEDNIERFMEHVKGKTVVIMCAEAVPWRCHRSLIADALIIRGLTVTHIMGMGSVRMHTLTPWAKVAGRQITYPGRPPEGP